MQYTAANRRLIHSRFSSRARFSYRFFQFACIACVCFFGQHAAYADSEHHSLWAIQGKHNTVYVLGSVHLLSADEQFPPAIEKAYQEATKLVMEIDMDDLDAGAAQGLTLELGLLPQGETLQQKIGPAASQKVSAYAKSLGLDAAMLAPLKPWLAAVTLTQLQMMKLGLSADSGVEHRFVERATADHKEIAGLETLEQQLNLFAKLPEAQQTQFLLYSIEDASHANEELQSLLTAWRTGDTVAMTRVLAKGFEEFPVLYGPLTVDRNRNWIPPLEKMLADDKNYLVIVGVLHLAGKDGVLDLLQRKGYSIKQL